MNRSLDSAGGTPSPGKPPDKPSGLPIHEDGSLRGGGVPTRERLPSAALSTVVNAASTNDRSRRHGKAQRRLAPRPGQPLFVLSRRPKFCDDHERIQRVNPHKSGKHPADSPPTYRQGKDTGKQRKLNEAQQDAWDRVRSKQIRKWKPESQPNRRHDFVVTLLTADDGQNDRHRECGCGDNAPKQRNPVGWR